MKRIVIPTDTETHKAVKAAAARRGLAMAEIARRLMLAWLRGEIELPEESWSTMMGRLVTDHITDLDRFSGVIVEPHEEEK